MENYDNKGSVKYPVAIAAGIVLLLITYFLPELLNLQSGQRSPHNESMVFLIRVLSFFIVVILAGNLSLALNIKSVRSKNDALLSGALAGALTCFLIFSIILIVYHPVYEAPIGYGYQYSLYDDIISDPFYWILLTLIVLVIGAILGTIGAFIYLLLDFVFPGNEDLFIKKRHLPSSTLALAALVIILNAVSLILATS